MSNVFIILGTLIAGASNSLLTKYQDNQCVRHCMDPDVSTHMNFEQPAIQTLQMFLGELAIFFVYYVLYESNFGNKRSDYKPIEGEDRTLTWIQSLSFALPSICDICATTLFNIGLVYTPVSIYQMTRGSCVLFVALLSTLLLKRNITKLEWVALSFVSVGVAIVGLSGSKVSEEESISSAESAELVVFGVILIVFASFLQACQFVAEEHILAKHSVVPMKLVYLEGFFGTIILLSLMIFLNFVIGLVSTEQSFQDSPFNLVQSLGDTFYSNTVLTTSFLIMISIAVFNYCGISLTHKISATSRSTVDTCRTLIVWILALVMGWESFSYLQSVGFCIMVFGALCYNGVFVPESWEFVPQCLKTEEEAPTNLMS